MRSVTGGGTGSGKRAGADYRAVSGSEIDPMPGAQAVGAAKASDRIQVTVLLRSRAPKAAVASVNELAAQMPAQRQYLSRHVYEATHGADPADIQEIVRFARQNGLRVIGKHAAARTVQLSGTVADFSRAFRVALRNYRHPLGTYRGRTGSVCVPAKLADMVEGVFGLDNRPVAKPHFRIKKEIATLAVKEKDISYTPPQVADLYKFPGDADGEGQCIGIIELGGGYTTRDLNAYFKGLGIDPPKVISVSVDGVKNKPTRNPNGDDGEVALDIEVAGAIAPAAKIVVYFTSNTNQGFLRGINQAVHDDVHKPSVISISWGGAESTYTKQSLKAYDEALQAAGLLGITVCVASGDDGSSDGVRGKKAHVDFPASSPHALACGGTSLKASGGSITSEVVWNDGPGNGATGGGISDYFPLPSWQKGAGIPRSVNKGRIGRGLPDVAGNADQDTGYKVRVDGKDQVLGGTSAVAPLMAGLIALLNQKLGKPVGFLNALLYSKLGKPDAFRDITKGNNDLSGKVGGYKARVGWDACTGFGSPDGTAILNALQKGSQPESDSGDSAASGATRKPVKKKKPVGEATKSR